MFGLDRLHERLYPTARFVEDVHIERAEEPTPLLQTTTYYGVPRLLVNLDILNASPHLDAVIERLRMQVDTVIELLEFDISLPRGPRPVRLRLGVTPTDEQRRRIDSLRSHRERVPVKIRLKVRAASRVVTWTTERTSLVETIGE